MPAAKKKAAPRRAPTAPKRAGPGRPPTLSENWHMVPFKLADEHYVPMKAVTSDLGQTISEYIRRLVVADLRRRGRIPPDGD